MVERSILIAVAWADIIIGWGLRIGRLLLCMGIGVTIHYAMRRFIKRG